MGLVGFGHHVAPVYQARWVCLEIRRLLYDGSLYTRDRVLFWPSDSKDDGVSLLEICKFAGLACRGSIECHHARTGARM